MPLIGPCLRCLRQSQGLRKNGYTVSILARKITPSIKFDDSIFEGIQIVCKLPSPLIMILRELANIVYSWRVILKTINQVKPDIVHVHNSPESIAFATSIVCSFKRIPFIYDAHDGVYELISSLEINPILKRIYLAIGLFFEKTTLQRCAGILTVSEALKESMLKRAGNYIGDKPFVVMRNINPELSDIANSCQEASEGNYILHSGTLYTATIGLEDVFDIITDLNRKTGVKLVIAGDGPYKRKLEEYANVKGVKKAVDFLGHISREELYRRISGAKLCIMPFKKTRHMDTVLPNKLFEYMALGKPFAYPDLPGFREVLGINHEGKYEADNKDDMRRVIENMLSNEKLRKSAGKKNRELLKEITFEKEMQKLLGLYHLILKQA
jgi:glycosyltransferase involved in cell wall biosynthesis